MNLKYLIMNPVKFLINGTIGFLLLIIFIILLIQLPKKNMFLSQVEFSIYFGLWLSIVAFYLGLVNIKDIDPSTNTDNYTIKSIIKNSGFYLFFMVFINIVGISISYSKSYPLSPIYIIEHLDYIQILSFPIAYICYTIGMKINLWRAKIDNESNITSGDD